MSPSPAPPPLPPPTRPCGPLRRERTLPAVPSGVCLKCGDGGCALSEAGCLHGDQPHGVLEKGFMAPLSHVKVQAIPLDYIQALGPCGLGPCCQNPQSRMTDPLPSSSRSLLLRLLPQKPEKHPPFCWGRGGKGEQLQGPFPGPEDVAHDIFHANPSLCTLTKLH